MPAPGGLLEFNRKQAARRVQKTAIAVAYIQDTACRNFLGPLYPCGGHPRVLYTERMPIHEKETDRFEAFDSEGKAYTIIVYIELIDSPSFDDPSSITKGRNAIGRLMGER
jgi:hypothetical protein